MSSGVSDAFYVGYRRRTLLGLLRLPAMQGVTAASLGVRPSGAAHSSLSRWFLASVVIPDECDGINHRTIAQLLTTIAGWYDGLMRETEKIGPPWELELTREDGRLVEVVIRATGDGELGTDAIREATNAALTKLRRRLVRPGTSSLVALRRSYEESSGKMTPQYLARLAVSYAEVASHGRAVMPVLSRAIDGNPATIKGHVLKAREEGYLTPATQGKEGGEVTDKAREVLGLLPST